MRNQDRFYESGIEISSECYVKKIEGRPLSSSHFLRVLQKHIFSFLKFSQTHTYRHVLFWGKKEVGKARKIEMSLWI